MNPRWWLWLLVPMLLYIIAVGLFYLFQDKIVFQPKKLPAQHRFDLPSPYEEFLLTTTDDVKINALLIKSTKINKGVVFYLHGNADNLERWSKYAVSFTNRGYDVLVIDYRGYGKSGGHASEANLYFDAQKIFQWLRKKYQPEEIIIYGRSLGSAVATHLATKEKARMLILETPFNNMPAVLQSHLPYLWMPFELNTQMNNDRMLAQVNMPVKIVHGTHDEIVPFKLAEKLKKRLKPGDIFLPIQNGMHKNLATFAEYQLALDQWLGIDEFAGE